jgi:hypothetical protein
MTSHFSTWQRCAPFFAQLELSMRNILLQVVQNWHCLTPRLACNLPQTSKHGSIFERNTTRMPNSAKLMLWLWPILTKAAVPTYVIGARRTTSSFTWTLLVFCYHLVAFFSPSSSPLCHCLPSSRTIILRYAAAYAPFRGHVHHHWFSILQVWTHISNDVKSSTTRNRSQPLIHAHHLKTLPPGVRQTTQVARLLLPHSHQKLYQTLNPLLPLPQTLLPAYHKETNQDLCIKDEYDGLRLIQDRLCETSPKSYERRLPNCLGQFKLGPQGTEGMWFHCTTFILTRLLFH